MINLSRKLYISLFTLLLMVIVVGTTTFAWLKLNPNAFFDEMEISITSNEDLKISVDGTNYKNSLTATDIKSAIAAKANGYTLKWNDSTKMDDFYDTKTKDLIPGSQLDKLYGDIKMKPVHSMDGKSFESLLMSGIDVQKKMYIELDIYFESITNNAQTVYFSNREFEYEDGTVIPKTEILVKDPQKVKQDIWEYVGASFDTYDPLTGAKLSYNYGMKNYSDVPDFSLYASDAVRFTLSTTSSDGGSDKIIKHKGIYEINQGRGSYATDLTEDYYVGTAGVEYDATKNVGFTYYNTVRQHNLDEGTGNDKLLEALVYKNLPNTYKGLDTTEAAEIITLNSTNQYGRNGNAKMTITFWLEGWDADCIDPILDQVLDIKMSFTNYNTVNENEPVRIRYAITNPNNPSEVLGYRILNTVVEDNLATEIDERTVLHQIVGQPISDKQPAYVEGNTTHPFKGWGLLQADGTVVPWDFSEPVRPKSISDLDWTLVSMWA